MKVLRFLLCASLLATYAYADIKPFEGDVIREGLVEEILNIQPSVENTSEDLKLMRYLFSQEQLFPERPYPKEVPIPWLQIFHGKNEVEIGKVFKISSAIHSMELVVDSNVDLLQKIPFNTKLNEFSDIVDYLKQKTDLEIYYFAESKFLLVLPPRV